MLSSQSQYAYLLAFPFLIATVNADAFAPRVTQVPSNPWSCSLCHVSPYGGGLRTTFGEDVRDFARNGSNMDWENVCQLDSDDDGATNGVELGDPSCVWRRGDNQIMFDATDPNDPNDFPQSEMMAGTDMAGTDMAGTDMAGTDMAGTDMAGTDMAGTDMAGTDMAGTDMAGTDMAGTDMAGTDMAGTDVAGEESPVTCEEACEYIIECSIEICDGYDESARQEIAMLCAAECNPEFASIAVTQSCNQIVNMIKAQDAVYEEGCDGEEMAGAGEEMAGAGEEMAEAGEEMAEAGEEMAETSEEMVEAGEEMTETTNSEDSGCQTSTRNKSAQRSIGLLLSLFIFWFWRRRDAA